MITETIMETFGPPLQLNLHLPSPHMTSFNILQPQQGTQSQSHHNQNDQISSLSDQPNTQPIIHQLVSTTGNDTTGNAANTTSIHLSSLSNNHVLNSVFPLNTASTTNNIDNNQGSVILQSVLSALPQSDDQCTLAMVTALVDEVRRLDNEVKTLKRKRKAMEGKENNSNGLMMMGMGSIGSENGLAKRQKVNRNMLLKKITMSVKKALKGTKFFSSIDACNREIKVQEMMSKEEFETVFGSTGVQIQPTPENNPNSTVIIKVYNSEQAKEALNDIDVKGEVWLKGGCPTRGGFFGGGGFTKGKKIGSVRLTLLDLKANYSTKSQKLMMTFTFINAPTESDDDDIY